jgi:hypothetical protein
MNWGRVWRVRTTAAASLMAVLMVVLCGCDPHNNQQGPISIRSSENIFVVVLCRDIHSTGIDAYYRDSPSGAGWVEFWNATGSVDFVANDELTTERVNEDFTTSPAASTPRVTATTSISISISNADAPGENIVGAFDFSGQPRDSPLWRHPDGSMTKEPCLGLGDGQE